ncbi:MULTISPECIES: GPO family capsid scaffolding protein [Mycetohabitans]|uniref:GPO family capsid scaffolding protein n=1 Tax=Mycetohabitans TaxID=2571159 RepID=UPI001F3CC17E|nr:GPO family capsid scaffolding protein [Mycetohabitans sp. B3]MCF2135147.1 GPO family capsid scaffolding protein [Mycetohabitans sp. B3]
MPTLEHPTSKSKWFRIAVEGATTDGRTISREWIAQMAKNYSRTLYGARVNLEHIRGVLPDGPFNAYGDVLALEARDETGEFAGKVGLYAQIEPTPNLVELTRAKQKIYTSCEVDPSFADTKQAYLVGLAVTDSPASLGTEMLTFAASAQANPLAPRKQSPQNVFSEAIETAMEFESTALSQERNESVFSKIADILGLIKKKGQSDENRFGDLTRAIETIAEHGRNQAEQMEALHARLEQLNADVTRERNAHTATAQALAELTATLSEPSNTPRPVALGQRGPITTDC